MKEQILEVLKDIHEAKTLMEINDLLNLHTVEEYKDLSKAVEELVEEYELFRTKKEKYLLIKNCPGLKIGKIAINKKGFGFLILDKEDDIYIGSENLNNAIHNDTVLVEIIKKGLKPEGKVLKIVKRDLNNVVGEIIIKDSKMMLKPDDEKLDITIYLSKETTKNCVEGHKILAHLSKNLGHKNYLADCIKIIGHKDDAGIDILSIAYKYNIIDEFNEEVIKELDAIPDSVDPKELENRKDLTNEVIFTIDGSDTKDIDDAISLTYKDGIYNLGVHIADVSHYVKENTALGDEAYNRGTSSYLADTVIPMIPHKLSNGICSLNEGVIRLTMSCIMNINNRGDIESYDIFPSFIKSNKKMTYDNVNKILEDNTTPIGYEPYKDILLKMHELAKILRKKKVNKGYIEFDIPEAKVIQDENGKAIDIKKREQHAGESLIEDFMIEANVTVATHIANMELPFIYRIHDIPNADKIDDFKNLVHALGYKIETSINEITPKSMQRILNNLKDKPEFTILSSLLLRSMKKAEYSKNNIGHFGLALDNYTHFTSPIRRYPDLTVHRLLKTYLIDKDFSMSTINYLDNALISIAEHSSEREVASINAERDVNDMKMAEYMESHIGEEYEGTISSVTNFGFFVELENLVEGLVHVNSLKGDYYNYVPELLSLIGKSTKKTYRVGDKVKIKVINASKENALIDFEIVKEEKHDRSKK
ncbi:MAG: ribonuclease R [Bacilli bacterium]|jgi:ribonuclease R|nr:ribonuclease R [Bacilli bacterium]